MVPMQCDIMMNDDDEMMMWQSFFLLWSGDGFLLSISFRLSYLGVYFILPTK
jgi:hypothetical protein